MALSLAGVVTALCVLLLHTTSQVSTELQRPLFLPEDALRQLLQEDLDHLLPESPLKNEPSLAFAAEEPLRMVSLRPDKNGIPHAFVVHYALEDSRLLRIATGGIPEGATTTLVLRSVRSFTPRGFRKSEEMAAWPLPGKAELPERLELEVQSTDPLDNLLLTLELPAAFRVDQSVPD